MHDCIIGMIYDYENTRLVTYDDLVKEYESDVASAEAWGRELMVNSDRYSRQYFYLMAIEEVKFSRLDRMTDKRNGAMRRFDYCPDCGAAIGWKALRQSAKEYHKANE